MAKKPEKNLTGPDGRLLPPLELPSPKTRRWVSRKKADVVAAVDGGMLSLDQACKLYALSVNEFVSWKMALNRFGLPGLRATHARESRQLESETLRHRY